MTQVILFPDGNQLLNHRRRVGGQVALSDGIFPDLLQNLVAIGIPQVQIRIEAVDLILQNSARNIDVCELLQLSDILCGSQP